ncbi:hypothetical protein ACFVHW_21735, partial [Streptomyces sp. NPDC127110]|uniref:hypothetical protein n=1 Tax=Streptomyces sp. NPDC127110 TaxID=3345362 RepID=UPI00363E43C8
MRPISAARIPFLASGGATAALLVTVLGAHDANAVDQVRVEQSNLAGLGYLAADRVDGGGGPPPPAPRRGVPGGQPHRAGGPGAA